MSIRLKVVLAIAGVMTLVFGILLVVVTADTYSRSRDLEGRMRDTLRPVILRWVDREQWLDNRTWSEFQYKLSDLNPPGGPSLVRRFAVVEADGRISAVGGMSRDEAPAFVAGDSRLAGAIENREVVLYPEQRHIAVPVQVAGAIAGVVKLEVNTGPLPTLQESLVESFLTLALIIGASTVVLVAATYFILDRRVLNPLRLLLETSSLIAEGNLTREVPGEEGRDEMAGLIGAFNAMMREVRNYREHLEKLVAEEKARVEAAQRRLVIAQRLAATGTLAAGIAHEVNNPLGGMINATRRLLKDETQGGRRKEYLELILDGLVRVQDTVKRILQFTPRDVKPQAVDLRNVCDKALELISHRSSRRGIAATNEMPEDVPPVFGDPSELQQVFLNVLINSVDAVAENKGRIGIFASVSEGNVEIEIRDNGCGMTEEQISRAFDLFYTTKDVGQGSGLGLSIVHNIVESHHGKMEIRSKAGEGTSVIMTFPVMPDSGSGRLPVRSRPAAQP